MDAFARHAAIASGFPPDDVEGHAGYTAVAAAAAAAAAARTAAAAAAVRRATAARAAAWRALLPVAVARELATGERGGGGRGPASAPPTPPTCGVCWPYRPPGQRR